MKKLRPKDLAAARELLAKKQGNVCPLCTGRFGPKKGPALDHDHSTGYIRDVLCRNCNGMEGKVFNLSRRAKYKLSEVEWLENLVAYHKRHARPQHGGYIHPTHKTEAEKRLARNKKQRDKRKALREKSK